MLSSIKSIESILSITAVIYWCSQAVFLPLKCQGNDALRRADTQVRPYSKLVVTAG